MKEKIITWEKMTGRGIKQTRSKKLNTRRSRWAQSTKQCWVKTTLIALSEWQRWRSYGFTKKVYKDSSRFNKTSLLTRNRSRDKDRQGYILELQLPMPLDLNQLERWDKCHGDNHQLYSQEQKAPENKNSRKKQNWSWEWEVFVKMDFYTQIPKVKHCSNSNSEQPAKA